MNYPVDTERGYPVGMADVLAELQAINAKLATIADSRSSVEIKTSTRGVDVTTKAYAGSPIIEAEGEAVASYFRTINSIQDRLTNGSAA